MHSSEHVLFLRIFFFLARRTPRFFYFPIGKSSPTDSSLDPPFSTYRRIGTCSFASSLLLAELSILRDPMALVNTDFLSPYLDFCPYRGFATRDVTHFEFLTPDTRCAESPMHMCELTFSTSRHFFQDFGIRGIVNPNVNGFRNLPFPDFRYYDTCTPLALTVAHTTLLSGYRGSRFQVTSISCLRKLRYAEPRLHGIS
jgi:hypothetical protein